MGFVRCSYVYSEITDTAPPSPSLSFNLGETPGEDTVRPAGVTHFFVIKNYRWTGHKFHHRFNDKTFVRPISANAVTWIEFVAAYAIPLMAGILIFRPAPLVADLVIISVSLANLFIHTPEKVLSMRWAPAFLVTNRKHLYHHQIDSAKFLSAPILDLDRVLGLRVPYCSQVFVPRVFTTYYGCPTVTPTGGTGRCRRSVLLVSLKDHGYQDM